MERERESKRYSFWTREQSFDQVAASQRRDRTAREQDAGDPVLGSVAFLRNSTRKRDLLIKHAAFVAR